MCILNILKILALALFFSNINKKDLIMTDKEIASRLKTFRLSKKTNQEVMASAFGCAVIAKCDAFITTDDGILKRYKRNDIDICTPITFFNIYGKEII